MVSGLAIDKPICHFNLASQYRGGERQTELLVRALAARGISQRLVVKKGHSLVARCADIDDLHVCEVASNPIAAGLAAKGSRITHSHDGRTVYSALLASLVFGAPYVITRRVVAPQSRKILRAWAYRRATPLVAVSNAVVSSLRIRVPDLDPVVIPDASAGFAIDEGVVAAIRAARPGKVLIGHAGALDHSHKGQSTIIEAARIAAREHPDWHFLLCGSGKDEQRFRREIGDLSNVELVGWVENVGDYLASFDIFLYPSLHEALGSTILDALQLGLPVVASNVGGIPELVEDRVNGRLIAPEDAAAMVAALAGLLSDAPALDHMRESNRAKARRFDVAAMADAYLSLYRAA